jgi:hypothetical protein
MTRTTPGRGGPERKVEVDARRTTLRHRLTCTHSHFVHCQRHRRQTPTPLYRWAVSHQQRISHARTMPLPWRCLSGRRKGTTSVGNFSQLAGRAHFFFSLLYLCFGGKHFSGPESDRWPDLDSESGPGFRTWTLSPDPDSGPDPDGHACLEPHTYIGHAQRLAQQFSKKCSSWLTS